MSLAVLAKARVAAERVLMGRASSLFDVTLTPYILHQIKGLSREDTVAWWAGFCASLVGAMAATVGERKAMELCDDLYDRAKDFENDLKKQGLGVCSVLNPSPK